MKNMSKLFLAVAIVITLYACGDKLSFEDQIIRDVTTRMGTGICDSIPKGSVITKVNVGEIVPIGDTGLIDVSLEFDFETEGQKTHKAEALLYSKSGSRYTLEAIGGCEYERKK